MRMTDAPPTRARQRNMSAIKAQDTKPETAVRSALHAAGFRYRLHGRNLPGRPDLVFPKHLTVVFVHGCFWHRHDCPYFRWPATRAGFWQEKLTRNAERDREVSAELLDKGWRVVTVWECSLRSGYWTAQDIVEFFKQWFRVEYTGFRSVELSMHRATYSR